MNEEKKKEVEEMENYRKENAEEIEKIRLEKVLYGIKMAKNKDLKKNIKQRKYKVTHLNIFADLYSKNDKIIK